MPLEESVITRKIIQNMKEKKGDGREITWGQKFSMFDVCPALYYIPCRDIW